MCIRDSDKSIQSEVAINPVPTSGRKYTREGVEQDMADTGFERVLERKLSPDVSTEIIPSEQDQSSWFNPFTWFGS